MTSGDRRLNAASHFIDGAIARGFGERPAYLWEGQSLSYRELHELVNRAGNALRDLGVEPEHRVLLCCLDGPDFVTAFWGAIKIGAVPVPVNTLLRTPDYAYLLNDSRARAVVVSAPLLSEVGPALGDALALRHVLVGGGAASRHASWDEHLARARSELEAAPTTRDDPALWLYSSGSTGLPKGAIHRHWNMVVCAQTYAAQVLGLRETDRVFSAAKLFFAYGLGNAGYFPLAAGAAAVLYPHRPTPETVFQVITQHRPTLFFGVPTLYAGMLAVPDVERRFDLTSLRLCVSAGEALPAELYRRWRERFGVELIDGIGTTELLHIFLSNRPGAVRPGSSGVPVPGYAIALVDDEGQPVPRGEIGNLRVKADSVMWGYWNQYDKTRAALHGQWIHTGDKYYQDEDGYYWYCGRADDMLKVGGIWVSPVEVESALIGHPAVLEAAVVPAEDDDRLVKPRAFVVLKDPGQAAPALVDELKQFVKDRIAPYKFPRWIDFVPELPKTATGKVQRFKLRRS